MNDKQAKEYLNKAEAWCARSEHCIADLKLKLKEWVVPAEYHPFIISQLIETNFINEERYTRAFVSDKSRFNKWGKVKLRFLLRQKNIPEDLIEQAISEKINPTVYQNTCKALAQQKWNSIKTKKGLEKQNAVIRFLASRGFETDLAIKAVKPLKD